MNCLFQNNNLEIDKIAKRQAKAARDLKLMSCPKPTFYRRLRKLKVDCDKKYLIATTDYENRGSVVVGEEETTATTEQRNSIVSQ